MLDSPRWYNDRPLTITGSWDSSPIYRHRRGGSPLWTEDEYVQRYQTSTVEAMANLGINFATLDFFKCFGLEAERSAAENARGFIQECNRRGICVGAYVGSTVGYETLRLEAPDCVDWIVRGDEGAFLYYQSPGEDQPFRARVYFMHPGYRAYIRKVLHAAILDFGANQIHFDSASVMAAPEIFYHPLAIQDFRNYLQGIDAAERFERLGFCDVREVLPPRFVTADTLIINDPLFQYWADFRCSQLVAYFTEMADYIRGLKSDVSVAVNTVVGIFQCNQEWAGVDHARLLPVVDMLWNEEAPVAGLTAGGVMMTKIRSFKMVASMGRRMLTCTGGPGYTTLTLAESMAYNRQTIGMVGDPLATLTFPADQTAYVQFFRNQFEYYRDADAVADVAVLHSFRTMTCNSLRPLFSGLLFQQALIQGRILFDIIFDQHLADLSRYKVLVLPDQECLDDRQMAAITDFVQAGGGVVITENTSLYTPDRRRRKAFGLESLLPNVPVPQWNGLGREDSSPANASIVQNVIGRGRAAYVPDVKQPEGLLPGQYPLPPDWEALLATVRWAAGEPLWLEVTAPNTVTAEMKVQNDGSRYVIHLINFEGTPNPARKLAVQFRVPEGRQVSTMVQLSPDQPGAIDLTFTEANGIVSASIAELQIYCIVVVSLDGAAAAPSNS